jgi:hypothetical protein
MLSQQDLDNATANLADTEGQVQAAQAQLEQASLNLSYTQSFAHRRRRGPRARARRQPRGAGRADAAHDRVAARPHPRELPDERGRLHSLPRSLLEHLDQRDLAWAKSSSSSTSGGHGRRRRCRGAARPRRRQHLPASGRHRGGEPPDRREHRDDPDPGPGPNPDGSLAPGAYGQVRSSGDRRRVRACS